MSSVRRAIFAFLRIGLGVAVLIYLAYSGALNRRALLGLGSSWHLTIAAAGLLVLTIILTAARLSILLDTHGHHLPLGLSIRLTLLGSFFNSFLLGSSGGDLVKFFYMTRENHGRKLELVTIGLFDRAVGMFALLVWPLLAAPLFPHLIAGNMVLRKLLWSAALIALSLLIGLLLCFSKRVVNSRPVALLLEKVPSGEHIRTMIDTVQGYRCHPIMLLWALAIALATHTCSVGATLLIARISNPGGNLWQASLLIPVGFLINTIPLSPGGLGVGEAAFNALFSLVGLTGGADALLGWRLLTILLSLPGLPVYLHGRGRFVSSKQFDTFAVAQTELE
jgi:uncharacterized membrane protein YbhN (UPF0104 family)